MEDAEEMRGRPDEDDGVTRMKTMASRRGWHHENGEERKGRPDEDNGVTRMERRGDNACTRTMASQGWRGWGLWTLQVAIVQGSNEVAVKLRSNLNNIDADNVLEKIDFILSLPSSR